MISEKIYLEKLGISCSVDRKQKNSFYADRRSKKIFNKLSSSTHPDDLFELCLLDDEQIDNFYDELVKDTSPSTSDVAGHRENHFVLGSFKHDNDNNKMGRLS